MLDAGQRRVWEQLERLAASIAARKACRGLYIHGSVGSGKTMLMDRFFAHLPATMQPYEPLGASWKHREHWAPFLRRLMMHPVSNRSWLRTYSCLETGALNVRRRHRLLCLDEMQIVDVADARAASTLLHYLLRRSLILHQPPVTVVMTSNRHPSDLFTGGDAFADGLQTLMGHLDVLELTSDFDYRRRKSHTHSKWLYPICSETDNAVQAISNIPDCICETAYIEVDGRKSIVGTRVGPCLVAPFKLLCDQPLGVGDYVALLDDAQLSVNHLVLTNVPLMNKINRDPARRLMLLVDAVYDRWPRVRLTVQCNAAHPDALFAPGMFDNPREKFLTQRTVSRLIEMTSEQPSVSL